MKFGKYLLKRHVDLPEYAPYFLDYKGLKKLMKQLAAQPAANDSEQARVERLKQSRSIFFFQLERELEKVTTFYNQKEADLNTRLDVLMQKKQLASQGGFTKQSIAYISIHEGLLRFRRDLDRLEQFVELNATGFSKALKKWDKQSKSHTKELYLTRAVEVQPMFNRDVLVKLSDKSSECLMELEALGDGETVIFEQSTTGLVADASHDLFHEFVTFATSYQNSYADQAQAMQSWVEELKNTGHITQVFLRTIPTLASDDALMHIWQSNCVDPTCIDEISSRTALHLLSSYRECLPEALQQRTGEVIPAKINRSALFLSVLNSNSVDINARDGYGCTPLICAAVHNRRDFLKELINRGAAIDCEDNDNLGALHYSIFHRYLGCVEDLLDAGAKTAGVNTEKQYVPLNFACQHGASNAVDMLLKKRSSDPMVADAEGLFPLHIVARAGFANLVRLLVKSGAGVNTKDKLNAWTPLIYASSYGHASAVNALLEANADPYAVDDDGKDALFYATWEGHPSCLKQLIPTPSLRKASITSSLTNTIGTSQIDSTSIDLEIPDLELPPPMMPLKRYGHNFLDANTIIVQIRDISLQFDKDRRGLSAGRLTITSSSTKDSIPRNVVLPVPPQDSMQTFEVDQLNKFSLTFEVLPTFGVRMLARSIATCNMFTADTAPLVQQTPLLDFMMRPIGTLSFTVLQVKPFAGQLLDIQKYDTYWKSTAQPDASSMITSSSLHGEYRRLVISLTKDMIPVLLDMATELPNGVKLPVMFFTLSELRKMMIVVTLEEWVASGFHRLNVHLPYPTNIESKYMMCQPPPLNVYADRVLAILFKKVHKARRAQPLVFSSSNPDLCAVLNWKQPNYPVLYCAPAMRADGRYASANRLITSDSPIGEQKICKSLKEASAYAAANNIMGLVVPGDILNLVPEVVNSVRSQGLVLIAEKQLKGQTVPDTVDGYLMNGESLKFPKSVN